MIAGARRCQYFGDAGGEDSRLMSHEGHDWTGVSTRKQAAPLVVFHHQLSKPDAHLVCRWIAEALVKIRSLMSARTTCTRTV